MTRGTVDGNAAAVSVAYRLSEVCCVYPITPASPMAELADAWTAARRRNAWSSVPAVLEMQSEGGAPGALQSGALASTFAASQGLLLWRCSPPPRCRRRTTSRRSRTLSRWPAHRFAPDARPGVERAYRVRATTGAESSASGAGRVTA